MGMVVTATAGLCIWIVLWALNVGGFDAILIAIVLVLIAISLYQLGPLVTGKKER